MTSQRCTFAAIQAHALAHGNRVRNAELCELFGLSTRHAYWQIKRYVRKGLLDRVERGVWQLTGAGQVYSRRITKVDVVLGMLERGEVRPRDVRKVLRTSQRYSVQLLCRMAKRGKCERLAWGAYGKVAA
jgi:predicted transcriptional regulator of viral defense system